MEKQHRQANFEILRVIAMLMIVIWHFYLHGFEGEDVFQGGFGRVNYLLSQYIIVICSSCVNLFVLISGFFLIDKSFNWKRFILLWLQVVFWGVGIALLFYFIRPEQVALKDVFRQLLPMKNMNYWFITRYLALMLLAPGLGKAAVTLTKQQYRGFLLALVFVGCTITMNFPYGQIMGSDKGYSLLWFIVLFFTGGYLKRFPPKIDDGKLLIIMLALSLVILAFVAAKAFWRHRFAIELPAYNGFGFIMSLPIFIWFQNRPGSFGSGRLGHAVTAIAPYSLGVYLISEHFCIWDWLWNGLFDWKRLGGSPWLIPIMLITCCIIFLVCAGLDYLRSVVFKVCRINDLAGWCSDRLHAAFNRL